ncbi:MAG: PAS domain-containing protein, partial [Proteobacteria bacterium]|nr:PAS domain-containing protein [Pseudomonadota bacterium]
MWISINSTALFQENEPSPYAVLTTLSDITDRKRANRKSKQAAAITANIQTGLHIYHLDNIEDSSTLRLFACNKAAEDITGLPSKDLIGRTLDQNFPGLRQLGIPQKYAEVVKSGKPINLDKVVFGDDRIQTSTYSVRVFPLPGNCVGAAFEDVSLQTYAVEQLENSEKRYRELYENSPMGYQSLDIEG